MKRTVDKSKKSNIKCEHCKHFCTDIDKWETTTYCGITGAFKYYWNRCKQFEWAARYQENADE